MVASARDPSLERLPLATDLEGPSTPGPSEEMWRALLLGTDPRFSRTRSWLKHVPSEPRCKMCAAPFGGLGSPLMHLLGRQRWKKNPTYCTFCFSVLESSKGGAEIEASFLFADVRGSTSIAEGISAGAFRSLLNRFYDVAARVLVEHDAIVDKFVGDEVVALFVPALTAEAHARRAVEAALALLRATGHADEGGPWIPVGAGVHTGVAFIGSVGEPPVSDLTALGDVVNTTARLASAAAAGEILVTHPAALASGLDTSTMEQRDLALKGKSESTAVFVATLTTPVTAQHVA